MSSDETIIKQLSEFTKEEILDTLKRIRKEEAISHFAILNIDYQRSLLIPLPEGNNIIDLISKSEILIDSYSTTKDIIPISTTDLTVSFLSKKQYEFIKVCKLLGVDPDKTDEKEIPF